MTVVVHRERDDCCFNLVADDANRTATGSSTGTREFKRGNPELIRFSDTSRFIARMPCTARIAPGGVIYHVLNRGVER